MRHFKPEEDKLDKTFSILIKFGLAAAIGYILVLLSIYVFIGWVIYKLLAHFGII